MQIGKGQLLPCTSLWLGSCRWSSLATLWFRDFGAPLLGLAFTFGLDGFRLLIQLGPCEFTGGRWFSTHRCRCRRNWMLARRNSFGGRRCWSWFARSWYWFMRRYRCWCRWSWKLVRWNSSGSRNWPGSSRQNWSWIAKMRSCWLTRWGRGWNGRWGRRRMCWSCLCYMMCCHLSMDSCQVIIPAFMRARVFIVIHSLYLVGHQPTEMPEVHMRSG